MRIPLHTELKEEPKLEVLKEAQKYFKTVALLEYFEAERIKCIQVGNKRDEKIWLERYLKLYEKFLEVKQDRMPKYELESVIAGIIHRRWKEMHHIDVNDLIPELWTKKYKMPTSEILECIKETIKRVKENYIGIQQSKFLWLEEKIAALEYAKKNIHICLLLNKGVKRLESSSLSPGSISRIQGVIENNKDHIYAEGILGYLRIYLSRILDYNVRPKEISRYYIQELEPPENIISEEDWDKTNNFEAVVYLKKLIRKMKKELC